MKSKVLVTLAVVVTGGVLLSALAPRAQAQESCITFRAVIQAELFPENPVREGDVWGGTVYAYLGQKALVGRYSGNPGDTFSHGLSNTGFNGTDVFEFGTGNTFIAEANHESYPTPGVTPLVMGVYKAADKIVEGTGRFQKASGKLTVSGPFILWDFDPGPPRGRWNAEVSGTICGVE